MLDLIKKYKGDIIAVLLVVVISFLASIKFLGRDLWYDEAFTAVLVRQDWGTFWSIVYNDVHPPLYYILLKLFTSIFGFSYLSIRIFSFLPFALTLPFIYKFLSTQTYITRLSIFSAVALSPFFVGYATEVRMYSWLSLFVFLSVYYFYLGVYSVNKLVWNRSVLLSSLFFALSILTHYFGALLGLVYLYFLYNKFGHKKLLSNKKIIAKFAILPILGLTCIIPFVINQATRSYGGVMWIDEVSIWSLVNTLTNIFYGVNLGQSGNPQTFNSAYLPMSNLAIFAIIVFTLGLSYHKIIKDKFLKFLFISAAIPMSLVYILSWLNLVHLYVDRYFLPYLIFLFIFILLILYRTYKEDFVSLVVALYILALGGYYLTYTPDNHFQSLVKHCQQSQYKESQIVFDSPFHYTKGRYYIGDSVKLSSYSKDNGEYTWPIIKQDNIISKELLAKGDYYWIIEYKVDAPDMHLVENYKGWYIYKYNPIKSLQNQKN